MTDGWSESEIAELIAERDVLAERAEKLHTALRGRVIRPMWDVDFAGTIGKMCLLCGAEVCIA